MGLQLLGKILTDPLGDHATAVAKQELGVLLDAHVAGIVRALDGLWSGVAAFQNSFTRDVGVALHTVLYHLLDGAERGVPPPPREVTAEENRRCSPGWTAAKPAAKKFFEDLAAAKTKAKGGDSSKLCELRRRIFAPAKHKNLRPAAAGDAAVEQRAAGSKRVAAAPPAPPPADPAEAELRRRAACCLALAMGTHDRLGLQSHVHALQGKDDVLLLIASHAELRTTEWFARRLPKEIPTLRLQLRRELGRQRDAEWRADRLQLANQQLQRENERLRRQTESAVQGRERERAEGAAVVQEVREGAAAWKEAAACEMEAKEKERRQAATQDLREEVRWLTEQWMQLREELRQEKAAEPGRRRAQDEEMRAERCRLASEREERRAEAAELAGQVAELQRRLEQLQTALERVRETSKGGLLEQVAQLKQKVRELGARRTLNQRRMQTANLSDRRAREAEGRAAEAQARLGEFAIEDEETLQRAARADGLEKQARVALTLAHLPSHPTFPHGLSLLQSSQ